MCGDLCMNYFTFLTDEQVTGVNKLGILKKYGLNCAITDFSILLGGLVEDDAYTTEGEHSGFWWTETADLNYGYVRAITPWGRSAFVKMNHRVVGARPVLPYSSISSVASNKVRKQNGILEVEYGEYPQTVVPKGFAGTLERAYMNGTMNQTGKCYTTDSVSCQDIDTPFQARTHTEYEYNEKNIFALLVMKIIMEKFCLIIE